MVHGKRMVGIQLTEIEKKEWFIEGNSNEHVTKNAL